MSSSSFYELAERALALERSGKSLIRLNVGDTNLPTPKCVIDAAMLALQSTKSGYGPGAGLLPLREKIAEREGCEIENVVVGSGSKPLLFALLSVLCKSGDQVSIPAPYWPAYGLMCNQLGLRLNAHHTRLADRWNFDPNSLLLGKLAIICNPSNPTSTVYPESLMREVLDGAAKCGMSVILDEAYKGLAFGCDGNNSTNPIPRYDYETVIRVRSFSKEFNMEGWRLGYVIAPKPIAKRVISFHHMVTTCTPDFIQRAGIAALENEGAILKANKTIWKDRFTAVSAPLEHAGFRFAKPDSGIYLFVTHDRIKDGDDFASRLLGRGVVVAPGSSFGGKNYSRYLRICLNQSEANLQEAVAIMSASLAK